MPPSFRPRVGLAGPNDLPVELLCDVFVLLPFRDRVIVSHVCRYWRNASLGFPRRLWSHIVWRGRRFEALVALLDRARGCRVHLRIGFRYEPFLTRTEFEGAVAALGAHLNHIVVLRISFWGLRLPYGQARMIAIASVLCHPAPLLEVFSFCQVHKSLHAEELPVTQELPVNLFAGCAPRLYRMTLNGGWRITQACHALETVTHFGLSTDDLSPDTIDLILASFSGLRALYLAVHATTVALGDPFPLSLARFTIRTLAPGATLSILRNYSALEIPDLVVDYSSDVLRYALCDPHLWTALTVTPTRSPRHSGDVTFRFSGLHRRSLAFDYVPYWASLRSAPFAQLTDLDIYETALMNTVSLPVFERVISFKLLLKEATATNLEPVRVFDYCRVHDVLVVCPLLQRATIESRDQKLYFDEEDVVHFLRYGVHYDAQMLETVTLRNIHLETKQVLRAMTSALYVRW